jgi:restriction system protein
MAMWLLRGGSRSEDVPQFLAENRVFIGWGQDLNKDISQFTSRDELANEWSAIRPDMKKMTAAAAIGSIWRFAKKIQADDLLVIPDKPNASIHIAEVLSDYLYDAKAKGVPIHFRKVRWVKNDIPRSTFELDLLAAFGAMGTLYQIKKHDVERRIRKLCDMSVAKLPPSNNDSDDDDESTFGDGIDVEQNALDQIAALVISRFKGHEMERLVEAILQAKGYFTYKSPEGPDKGVDILAASGPLGFGDYRICVQVKSGDNPVDSPTLSQLIGTMQKVQANQGLIVAWGGFTKAVEKERPGQFFRVRLWNRDDLLAEFFSVYDKLDPDIRAEIPIKRIWSLAAQDDEE